VIDGDNQSAAFFALQKYHLTVSSTFHHFPGIQAIESEIKFFVAFST